MRRKPGPRPTINVPVTVGERLRLRRAARRAGMPLATWLRALGIAAAQEQRTPVEAPQQLAHG